MMTLRLCFEKNTTKEYHLEKGMSLTIGRKNDNDVVIENLGVSGYHARIDSVNDTFLLTDLKSKNGTFVNEELITSHWLNPGDVIAIGKHTLQCLGGEADLQDSIACDRADKTMVIDTDKYQAMLANSYSKATFQEIERETIGVLSFLVRGGKELKLTNKLTKIGKDPLADVVVDGFLMGKTCATISNRPSGYFFNYVGGFRKPKVNGKTVTQSVKLEEFDIIEAGSLRMQFIYKYAYKK